MSTLLDRTTSPTESGDGPRSRSRVRRSRVIAAAVVTVLVAVVVGWLLSWWSPVPLRDVVVEGASPQTAVEIRQTAAIAPGTALRDVDRGAVAQRVEEIAGVEGVALVLRRPWTVVIAVEERFPFATVSAGDGWTVVDAEGRHVRDVTSKPRRLPEVLGPDDDWPQMFAPLEALDPQIRARTRSASYTEEQGVELTLKGDRTVEWGAPERNAEKAEVLGSLLPLKASHYSVAVPERPAVSADAQVSKAKRAEARNSAAESNPTP